MLAFYRARSAQLEAGLPDKRLRLSRDRALILLKERFSPNRSHFGESCAAEPRAFSHTKCLPDSWSKMHAIVRPVHRRILRHIDVAFGRLSRWAAGPVVDGLLVTVD